MANLLKPVLGGHVTRGVGQSQSGSNQADVEGAPYWIEVKTGKRPNIMAAMQQAREATDGRVPVVFSKRDREKWLVTMESDAWLELLRLSQEAHFQCVDCGAYRRGACDCAEG